MREEQDVMILRLQEFNQGDLPIPDELDEAIQTGLYKAQWEKRKRKQRRIRWIWTVTAACILMLVFIGSVRYSPTFAAFVREIPGLEGFVKLIQKNYPSSMYMAIEHDLLQPIGRSDTHNGITFTVEGILADESRMIVFYSITGKRNGKYYHISARALDRNGQDVEGLGLVHMNYPMERGMWEANPYAPQQGTLDIFMGKGRSLPDEVLLHVQLSDLGIENTRFSPIYEVLIPIDHQFFANMKEEQVIGETIEIEGQSIFIDKVVYHPLTIELHLEYDENNTMHIFDPIDMYLEDDNGETYHLSHEILTDTNKKVLYFTSNYFHPVKHLWLTGEMFRAVDKDKMVVVVDTEKKEILQAPDHKIRLMEVTPMEEYTRLTFLLSDIDPKDRMLYTLLESKFMDGIGNVHQEEYSTPITKGSGNSDASYQFFYYYLKNEEYAQPLTFKIYYYPSYIRGDYRIQIK